MGAIDGGAGQCLHRVVGDRIATLATHQRLPATVGASASGWGSPNSTCNPWSKHSGKCATLIADANLWNRRWLAMAAEQGSVEAMQMYATSPEHALGRQFNPIADPDNRVQRLGCTYYQRTDSAHWHGIKQKPLESFDPRSRHDSRAASHASNSSAGSGGENRNPCKTSQPNPASKRRWRSVSTPSATTCLRRLSPIRNTELVRRARTCCARGRARSSCPA